MTPLTETGRGSFDRTNAIIAAGVWLVSFIVYALTVQPTFSYWDCGEFVACAKILGIPHPPGTPLFVMLGRIFSMIPLVTDVSHRVNLLSVFSSAFTAMFSYLLTVRLVRYFFNGDRENSLGRYIAYAAGIAGGFFVAFSATNWGNSIEAEVYGLAMALSVAIVWMTLIYWEQRGTPAGTRWMLLAFFLALLGIGVHMTVLLVAPVCALYYMFNEKVTRREWLLVCGYVILELLLVLILANGRGGLGFFYAVSGVFSIALLLLIWRTINWAVVVALGATFSLMISFSAYVKAFPIGLVILIAMALLSKQQGWKLQWKTGLSLLVVGFLGISVHGFIPIRSALQPRINENNPSRDFRTFMNYLDRKQYGQMSMVERMFDRRGSWSHQFGRHPHMGFWSYFEEQYSGSGTQFLFPFFVLGVLGLVVAIQKRLEVGLPLLTLFLITSVGLILYMNFADGTKYNLNTGDAYLEVRDRDYFFTPAFIFFGIAMGVGVAAVMQFVRERKKGNPGLQKALVYGCGILALLPAYTLANNWHENDRSGSFLPYNYAAMLLDSCEKDAILFTSGDNDTFPLWCIQEVYDYRRDVRVCNLSLLNTDWYVYQMKNQYNVPISLKDEQILWYPFEAAPGVDASRPLERFYDKARKNWKYLVATPDGGRLVKVQDMMVDEVVWESTIMRDNKLSLKIPIYFSSPPYGESPLKLRDHTQTVGVVYRLDWSDSLPEVDLDRGYDLFMNKYHYDGYQNSKIYRDENATGVFITVGVNGGRLFDQLMAGGDSTRALALANKLIQVYPEYWQTYLVLAMLYDHQGDSTRAEGLWQELHDTLTSFLQSNPKNLFYMQDLGLTKVELGQRIGDNGMVDEGVQLCWQAFDDNSSSAYAFRKLVSVLSRTGRYQELQAAADKHWEYGQNRDDPFLQQIRGMSAVPPPGAAPSQ